MDQLPSSYLNPCIGCRLEGFELIAQLVVLLLLGFLVLLAHLLDFLQVLLDQVDQMLEECIGAPNRWNSYFVLESFVRVALSLGCALILDVLGFGLLEQNNVLAVCLDL